MARYGTGKYESLSFADDVQDTLNVICSRKENNQCNRTNLENLKASGKRKNFKCSYKDYMRRLVSALKNLVHLLFSIKGSCVFSSASPRAQKKQNQTKKTGVHDRYGCHSESNVLPREVSHELLSPVGFSQSSSETLYSVLSPSAAEPAVSSPDGFANRVEEAVLESPTETVSSHLQNFIAKVIEDAEPDFRASTLNVSSHRPPDVPAAALEKKPGLCPENIQALLELTTSNFSGVQDAATSPMPLLVTKCHLKFIFTVSKPHLKTFFMDALFRKKCKTLFDAYDLEDTFHLFYSRKDISEYISANMEIFKDAGGRKSRKCNCTDFSRCRESALKRLLCSVSIIKDACDFKLANLRALQKEKQKTKTHLPDRYRCDGDSNPPSPDMTYGLPSPVGTGQSSPEQSYTALSPSGTDTVVSSTDEFANGVEAAVLESPMKTFSGGLQNLLVKVSEDPEPEFKTSPLNPYCSPPDLPGVLEDLFKMCLSDSGIKTLPSGSTAKQPKSQEVKEIIEVVSSARSQENKPVLSLPTIRKNLQLTPSNFSGVQHAANKCHLVTLRRPRYTKLSFGSPIMGAKHCQS